MDKIKDYVLGDEDGIAKTPAWASPLCGIPEWTIKALAREWGSKKVTTVKFGGGYCKGPYSHEVTRFETIVQAMQGLGTKGVYMYCMTGLSNGPARQNPPGVLGMRSRGFAPYVQYLTEGNVGRALLNGAFECTGGGGCYSPIADQFKKFTYPVPAEQGGTEVHMFWDNMCSLTNAYNGGSIKIQAYRSSKMECMVGQQPWFTNDCIYMDIILPISTKFEEDDIAAGGISTRAIVLERKAIEPLGEAKSDYEATWEVAKKLGLEAEFTEGRDVEEQIKWNFDMSGATDRITWEELNEKGYYVAKGVPKWWENKDGIENFADDPVKNPLLTPSGLLEFYSQRLAENFPDDKERGPIPKWIPGGPSSEGWTHDESPFGEKAKTYPMLMVCRAPRWRQHSQCPGQTWTFEAPTGKIRGYDGYLYEPVWINIDDAAEKGIKQGDIVKVFNDQGIILGGAYVNQRTRPSVIIIDHGSNADPIVNGPDEWIDRGTAVNRLIGEKGISKNAQGITLTNFLVGIEKLDPAEMESWKLRYPEAFARDYDGASGLVFESWVEGGTV